MLKLTILFVNFKGHNRTRMNGWLCIFYGPLVVILQLLSLLEYYWDSL